MVHYVGCSFWVRCSGASSEDSPRGVQDRGAFGLLCGLLSKETPLTAALEEFKYATGMLATIV